MLDIFITLLVFLFLISLILGVGISVFAVLDNIILDGKLGRKIKSKIQTKMGL